MNTHVTFHASSPIRSAIQSAKEGVCSVERRIIETRRPIIYVLVHAGNYTVQ